jgi:hypothetical protein
MKRKTVIKATSLPAKSPASFAILFWLLLDRLDAPQWAYGVLWTIVALLAIGFIYQLFTVETRDVPGFGEK